VLRIPAAEERTPALVVPLPAVEEKPAQRSQRRRKKRRRGSGEDWDKTQAGSSHGGRHENRQMAWMLAGGAVLLVLCVALILKAMLGGGKTPAPAPPAVVEAPIEKKAPDSLTDVAFLAAAEPLAAAFLSAKTVDELLPLVREPQRAAARIRAFHGGDAIAPEGLDLFNSRTEVLRDGPFFTVHVRTKAYQEKRLSFVETPQGLKIDWESWVGWSPLPWPEFIASRPTQAVPFRVNLSPVEYYNFGFTDDRKWRSFRLESPDGEHSAYAYVERGTVTDEAIQIAPEQKQLALTLLLKFPENIESRSQVIIEKVVAEGWLVENEESP
jgi:hypothetical protein